MEVNKGIYIIRKKDNMKFKRVFLIVLDSLGVGEAVDADKYNNKGANTLGSIVNNTDFTYPNLEKLGLLNVIGIKNVETKAYYTKASPVSVGKDTLTGHLEIMGINTTKAYQTFTDNGFPDELIKELEEKIGRKVIGNYSASGTEIIEQLGEEHMETGSIIVYTSADSVLQIAAHEDIISIDELYHICQIAREITLDEKYNIGRIIARPFIGSKGSFIRTSRRHDYPLDPPTKTVLDYLKDDGFDVISIGKIVDIFNSKGITESEKTIDNMDGINKIVATTDKEFTGLCFANLNDFDSKYGHRRNIYGYGEALKQFDDNLPSIINKLNRDDLLIITADHGNDPAYEGTDHTREKVPVLIYSSSFINSGKLEELNTFADIGSTIADNFKVNNSMIGQSFLSKLK